jgi:hypothetical protein
MNQGKGGFLAFRANIVLIGFLAIAGFYLITEHRAHLYGALPWLLILSCPLMHLFMHRGHRGHGGHGDSRDQKDEPSDTHPNPPPHAH